MALKQHSDPRLTFSQQSENAANYVLPFIEITKPVTAATTIFEVGCAEGGVLLPFLQRGCKCVGVDLADERVVNARNFLDQYVASGQATLVCQNIFDRDFLDRYRGAFDVIMLKDVIEHVPQQQDFITYLKNFLRPGGQIFFGFPPWYMPFGGHQQVCRKKWASVLPYYHLLPRPIYKGLLKVAGEHETVITELMEIKDTGITIERFERIIKASGLKVLHKQHYLFNPIYKYKFGVRPRNQFAPVTWFPYLRDFLTTCVYYTVG